MYTGIIPIRFLRNHLLHAGKAFCSWFISYSMLTVSMLYEVMESAMPSPMEKGDRRAVDKGYPGIKEGEKEGNSALL